MTVGVGAVSALKLAFSVVVTNVETAASAVCGAKLRHCSIFGMAVGYCSEVSDWSGVMSLALPNRECDRTMRNPTTTARLSMSTRRD